RRRLETAAKAQERSLNSELVARLEESFATDRWREERQEVMKVLGSAEKSFKSVSAAFQRVIEADNARWEAYVSAADPEVAKVIREISKKIAEERREARDQQAADEEPELFPEIILRQPKGGES